MLGTSTRQISTPRAALSLLRGGPQSPLPAHECATDDQLLAFVNGRLDKRSIERLDVHLGACATCAALLVAALGADGEQRPTPSAFGAHCWTFGPDTWLDRRYVLRRPLGHGGMGEVYEAFDVSSARSLALKTAKATQCDRPDQERRLASELALARRAGGPHVCQVYEVGLHREAGSDDVEIAYLTMELIPGQTLAQRLQRGALRAEEARPVARGLIEGVADIHGAGVIHRDIKSHNIMLRGGHPSDVSIIDFGLAIDARQPRRVNTDIADADSSFSFEGSPAYMAPEQFRETNLTPATDVFACGVVLFESITGQLPFRSFRRGRNRPWRDPSEIPLRAAELATNVPQPVDAFIARCMDLDPERRYPNAGAALTALEQMPPM